MPGDLNLCMFHALLASQSVHYRSCIIQDAKGTDDWLRSKIKSCLNNVDLEKGEDVKDLLTALKHDLPKGSFPGVSKKDFSKLLSHSNTDEASGL